LQVADGQRSDRLLDRLKEIVDVAGIGVTVSALRP
jgi:hypothetical protein